MLNALNVKLARGIVLSGAGNRSFCAGVDLGEAWGVQVAEIEEWFGTVCNIYKQILLTEKLVITALNSVAAGGGFQIALVSDQRVGILASRWANPRSTPVSPSIMGSYWKSLQLCWSKNHGLYMTGRLMEVEEARSLGLMNHLVARDQVVAKAC